MNETMNNKEENEIVESEQPEIDNTNIETEMINDLKQCKSCFQMIHISATVCQHCGQGQGLWRRHFGDTAIIVSIIMVLIALAQLLGAFKINVDASKALKTAKTAAEDANEALAQVISDANEINRIKHVIENQGTQIEFVNKEAFQTKNLLGNLLNQFQLINGFMMTVINAQNDNRKAFDQLEIWFKDKTFILSGLAFKAWTTILDEHNQPILKELPSVPWPEGTKPLELSLSELKLHYKSINWYFRPSLMEYIWKRDDFSKYERIEFLADVLKNDDSLRAVEYAGRYFGKATGLKKKTLAVSEFLDWWEKNKNDLKE